MEKLALLLTALGFFATVKQSSAQGGDDRTDYFLEEINKAKAQVDKYVSPKQQLYLVDLAGESWLFRAVSKKERDKWLETTQFSADQKKQVTSVLDALATSAAKKLPVYLPEASRFAHGTPEEIELLKGNVPGVSELTIHKIGIADAVWSIVKDNSGLPKYRFKGGYMWFKPGKQADHPYCWMYNIEIKQNYEGGGTYGASYANYSMRWLCGCPK